MIFTVTLLAISLSLDALGVGIAYGMRKIKIPLVPKLIICFFSIMYSGMAIILGKFLYVVLPPMVAKLAGVAILTGMGVYILIQAIFKTEPDPQADTSPDAPETQTTPKKTRGTTIKVLKDPGEGDLDRSGVIDIRESLLLGLALSIDAIGVGVGSALAGMGTVAVPFAIGLFQLLFLYVGTFLGTKIAGLEKMNKKVISIAPGLLLLTIAILRIK